jgi:hypothetical protein
VTDPAEIVVATQRGGALAKITAGILREDGEIEEVVIIQIKRDERFRHDPMNWSGELTVHCRDARRPGDGMVHIATLRHDEQWFQHLVAQPSPGLPQSDDWFVRHPGMNPWGGTDVPTPPIVPPVPVDPHPLDPEIAAKVTYFTGPHGELDFEKMRAYYGFASDDVDHFLQGDMSASQVVIEMERRKAGDAP